MFVAPFSKAAVSASAEDKTNALYLITPLEVFSLSGRYALQLVVWKLFILRMCSACFLLSTSKSTFPFPVFFTIWWVAPVAITLRNRRIRPVRILQMFNLGSQIWKITFIYFIRRYYLQWNFSLHHPPRNRTFETHLFWLRRWYTTSILKLGVGFWALANIQFSVNVSYNRVIKQWSKSHSLNAIDLQPSLSST